MQVCFILGPAKTYSNAATSLLWICIHPRMLSSVSLKTGLHSSPTWSHAVFSSQGKTLHSYFQEPELHGRNGHSKFSQCFHTVCPDRTRLRKIIIMETSLHLFLTITLLQLQNVTNRFLALKTGTFQHLNQMRVISMEPKQTTPAMMVANLREASL